MEEKKKYVIPVIKVIEVENTEIIASSNEEPYDGWLN